MSRHLPPIDDWATAWLTAVANGTLTMSQRTLSSVIAHGGVEHAIAVAQSLGVHLATVADDRGAELVIASVHSLHVLC